MCLENKNHYKKFDHICISMLSLDYSNYFSEHATECVRVKVNYFHIQIQAY